MRVASKAALSFCAYCWQASKIPRCRCGNGRARAALQAWVLESGPIYEPEEWVGDGGPGSELKHRLNTVVCQFFLRAPPQAAGQGAASFLELYKRAGEPGRQSVHLINYRAVRRSLPLIRQGALLIVWRSDLVRYVENRAPRRWSNNEEFPHHIGRYRCGRHNCVDLHHYGPRS